MHELATVCKLPTRICMHTLTHAYTTPTPVRGFQSRLPKAQRWPMIDRPDGIFYCLHVHVASITDRDFVGFMFL